MLGLHRTLEPRERLALAFGLGASGLGVATLLAGRLGCSAPGRSGSVSACPSCSKSGLELGAWGVGEKKDRRFDRFSPKPQAPSPKPYSMGFGLIAGPFLLVMALGAMLPTIDFDAIEYHLQGPKEYYQAGRIAFLPHNVYTSMPFGVEMLHLLGMEVLGDWWWGALAGQLLVACFAPAAAVLIAADGQPLGLAARGLVRGGRLPDDPLGLPAGGDCPTSKDRSAPTTRP